MRENSRMMIYTVVNYTAVGGHFLYENTKGADGYLALVLNPPPIPQHNYLPKLSLSIEIDLQGVQTRVARY